MDRSFVNNLYFRSNIELLTFFFLFLLRTLLENELLGMCLGNHIDYRIIIIVIVIITECAVHPLSGKLLSAHFCLTALHESFSISI